MLVQMVTRMKRSLQSYNQIGFVVSYLIALDTVLQWKKAGKQTDKKGKSDTALCYTIPCTL
jgi:hypothetical protein